MSGILTRRYKPGSIVYFEGDKSENIYILKTGRVMLSYLKPESGEEIKEEIRPGEFFGVKASIGRYPREETAQTLTETSVLVLTLADFEKLVLNNIQVVKKMLRVFSNQLRRIGKAVREVLGESNTINPEVELFKIGEYYFKVGKQEQALYAFKRYMNYYPDTKYSAMAMRRIKEIESGTYSSSSFDVMGDLPETVTESTVTEDFSFDDSPAIEESDLDDSLSFNFDEPANTTAGHTEFTSEMDDFVEDDSMSFSFDMEENSFDDNGIEKLHDEAVSFENSGDNVNAIEKYNEIINNFGADEKDSPFIEKSYFGLGKAYLNTNKLKESLQSFSTLMKNYPKSTLIKNALLYIGFIYEKSGDIQKAKAYYRKVASTPPKDKASNDASTRLSRLE